MISKQLAHGSGRLEEAQKETEALDPVIRNQGEHRKQIWPGRKPGDARRIRLWPRDASILLLNAYL